MSSLALTAREREREMQALVLKKNGVGTIEVGRVASVLMAAVSRNNGSTYSCERFLNIIDDILNEGDATRESLQLGEDFVTSHGRVIGIEYNGVRVLVSHRGGDGTIRILGGFYAKGAFRASTEEVEVWLPSERGELDYAAGALNGVDMEGWAVEKY